MPKVAVVTAFVPLQVRHMSADDYHTLGQNMLDATKGRYRFFDNFPLEKCWAYELCKDLPPATETPADRYASPADHVRSHIVQHSRTQWALQAVEEDPTIDVVIWLDLGILKQGAWRNNKVMPEHVTDLVNRAEKMPLDVIPFPGIEPKWSYDPHGNNWRFCGSTHIWPVPFLKAIDASYKLHLRSFIKGYKAVPLDLAIWPLVERYSCLPFQWYQAEYDASQLTEFPYA